MVAPIKSLLKDTDWTSQLLFLDDHTDATGGPEWQHDTDQPHAVIWCFPRACDVAIIRSLVAAGIPTVTYNRDFRFAGAGGVVADVTDVVQTQFNHLWDLGKRRFAVLSIDRPSPSIRQYRAVASELASGAGIDHHFTELIFAYRGIQRPSERMIQRIDVLMSGPDAPDAILCSDIFSFRGLEVWMATHREVRVPEDVAVATFDPIPYANVQRLSHQVPFAMMDHRAMLAGAIRLLEAQLTGDASEPPLLRIPAIMGNHAPTPPLPSPRWPRPVLTANSDALAGEPAIQAFPA